MFRPLLEAHIRLLGNSISGIKNKKLVKKISKIEKFKKETIMDTSQKSLCNIESISSIYHFGKGYGIIKNGDGFDLNEIKKYTDFMGDVAHGRKFYCSFEELVDIDKFAKKYINVIYSLITKISNENE